MDDRVDFLVHDRWLAGGRGEWLDRHAVLGEDPSIDAEKATTGSVDVCVRLL